jgi:hypothetical protein
MDRSSCILCLAVVLVGSSLLLIESTQAQIDRVTTYCTIYVDDIVEGQPVTATIQMSPATPTNEGYKVLMWVTSPDGVGDKELNGAWVKSILTDSTGRATVTFNVPTYSGKWYVDVSFGSSNFANHTILYLAGNWQTQFTVLLQKTPTLSSTVTPTLSPTVNPTVPEFPVVTLLIAAVLAMTMLLVYGKRKLNMPAVKNQL